MATPKNRAEFRDELAKEFINVLEDKGLEWRKEWSMHDTPLNAVTGNHYRGINLFRLSMLAAVKGYDDPRWVTMVQIMDKDGKYHAGQHWHLKKGSKATFVEYWFPVDLRNKQRKPISWKQYREAIENGAKAEEFGLQARYTGVFNATCIEGIPPYEPELNAEISADELINKLSDNMGVPIIFGGDSAYYSPIQDNVHLPMPEQFTSEYAFNAIALHELAHSTGHKNRLDRNQNGVFGSPEYAYEELVAEMCSAFVGFNLHTEPTEDHINNHKAYIQSWVQAIKDDPNILIKAVKDAQEAASYMDLNAELISEKEYTEVKESVITVSAPDQIKDYDLAERIKKERADLARGKDDT